MWHNQTMKKDTNTDTQSDSEQEHGRMQRLVMRGCFDEPQLKSMIYFAEQMVNHNDKEIAWEWKNRRDSHKWARGETSLESVKHLNKQRRWWMNRLAALSA